MTVRSMAGLVVFNSAVFAVGASLLWGARGWRWWTELARLGGVAYLLGVAALVVALTLELVVGAPIGGAAIAVTTILLAGIGVVVGLVRRLPRPALRPPNWRLPRLTVLGGLLVAAVVVYLEALFRSARLQPLSEWDAWWVWTLKAKALFYFGDLGGQAFLSAGPGGAYPPGLPLLEAGAFHAMGSVDVVTLHLQYWFLAAGFVAALAGLLATRVRPTILLPLLVLVLVMPSFTDRVTDGRADLPLAYLLASGALLLVLWLEERHTWQLAVATVLLAGAMLTKREGILLSACIFAAAFIASWRDLRVIWPKVAVSALVAFGLALPWRVWFTAQGLESDAPTTGYLGTFENLDRAWPSLRLAVRTLFDYDLWLLLPPLAVAAVVLAAVSGASRTAIFATAFLATAVAGCAWVIWSNPEYELTQDYGLTPIVRLVGVVVLVLGVLTPLALERAWSWRRDHGQPSPPLAARMSHGRGTRSLGWLVVALAALAYPASMLAGTTALRLPGGPPTFPSPSDCERPPIDGEEVRVVFGYVDTYDEADMLRDRASGVSDAVEVDQDGCGRLRVFVGGVPSIEEGRALAGRAEGLGLEATLEHDPRG